MSIVLVIAKREIDAYFKTVVGWLSLLGFVLICGLTFALILTDATNPAYYGQVIGINDAIIPAFFGTISVFLLLLSPALAMRIFSEDIRQKSFELLLSSPISSSQIVLGKFIGSIGYVAVMFIATLHCPAILFWLGDPSLSILFLNYTSVFLLTACFISVGMFTSACTSNQLVSVALSFGFLLILWFCGTLGDQYSNSGAELLAYLSPLPHIESLSQGLLQSKDIIYFLSFTAFFLFATHQRIEAYRWQ
jgi:ABC-2 type transport system permease protein